MFTNLATLKVYLELSLLSSTITAHRKDRSDHPTLECRLLGLNLFVFFILLELWGPIRRFDVLTCVSNCRGTTITRGP